jgi:hypothetical protein
MCRDSGEIYVRTGIPCTRWPSRIRLSESSICRGVQISKLKEVVNRRESAHLISLVVRRRIDIVHIEDAERLIIRWIREKPKSDYSNFGYDVYLSNLIRWYLEESGERDRQAIEQSIPNLWPTFVAAAWELCRRGVIRPGVRQLNTQSTEHGSGHRQTW